MANYKISGDKPRKKILARDMKHSEIGRIVEHPNRQLNGHFVIMSNPKEFLFHLDNASFWRHVSTLTDDFYVELLEKGEKITLEAT